MHVLDHRLLIPGQVGAYCEDRPGCLCEQRLEIVLTEDG